MRKCLLIPILLLISMSAMGCGMTPEMRQEIVDGVTAKATVAIKGKMREASGDVVEKVVEAVTKQAAELGISEENVKLLASLTSAAMLDAITDLIDNKVPKVIRAVVEKAVPKATESGGTGKGAAGWLYVGLNVLLGLGKKVVTGGLA